MSAGKLILFLLIITGLFVVDEAALNARVSAIDQRSGIFWQIERPGFKPSYLLGTVHSDDLRVINLPEVVSQKLRQADSFVAELKMDTFSIQEGYQLMLLPPGQSLESLIGKPRYQRCVELLAGYGMPAESIQRMKPWAVLVILSMPKPRTGIVLDHYLYQEAERQGKKTYGLETNREQIAAFESFNLQQQVIMLDDAIREFKQLPMIFDELLQFYLKRDLSGLERFGEKHMLQGDNRIARQFKQRVLLDRNHLMVRRMQPRLLEGNSFIAVGALHLPGEEGILRLLERQGYMVKPLY